MDEDVDKALKEITPEEYLPSPVPGNDAGAAWTASGRRAPPRIAAVCVHSIRYEPARKQNIIYIYK